MEDKKIINLKEKTTIYGTGKSEFMPKNKEYKVHPIHAEKLVKSGAATYAKA